MNGKLNALRDINVGGKYTLKILVNELIDDFKANWNNLIVNLLLDNLTSLFGSRVRFPAGAGNFSLHHHVQNGSGTHRAFYPMGTGGYFPGGKATEVWSWPLYSI
jgi:hypothetical protein